MTAILGLNFYGGVLMMSDTEESLGADAKSSCDKLHRFIFSCGSIIGTVITGGAGDSHLIECANLELNRFLNTEITEGNDLLADLNVFARSFFEESMRGYQGIAYELLPQFELLIALNIRNQTTRIFIWKGNRVLMLPADGHACIGTGVVQISPMLRDIPGAGRCDNMLFQGVRMMYHAKRAVAGVGGETEAIALHDNSSTHFFGVETTKKIEELAINLDRYLNIGLYLQISAVTPGIRDLEANIAAGLADLPRIMKIYRDAYSRILEPSGLEIPEESTDMKI